MVASASGPASPSRHCGSLRARRSVNVLSISKSLTAPLACCSGMRSALVAEGYVLGKVLGRSRHNRGFTVLSARKGQGVFAAKESSEPVREGVLAEVLQKEFAILRSLSHPCVVRAEHFLTDDFGCAMVMELAAGCQLEPVLPWGSVLTASHRHSVLQSVLEAVAYMHRNDVAHLDLDAQNVMVHAEPRVGQPPVVKVVDFGCAVRAPEGCADEVSDLDRVHTEILPPAAPLRGPPRSCDVFATGLLAGSLAAGRPLRTRDVTPAGRLELGAVGQQLHPAAEAHLSAMLALEPGARPSAEECLQSLPRAEDWLAAAKVADGAAER